MSFEPTVTITLAEYRALLDLKDRANGLKPQASSAPVAVPPNTIFGEAPTERAVPFTKLEIEDIAPSIEEKLLRGMSTNQENLNTADFNELSAWVLRLARLAFGAKPFTGADLQDAIAGRGIRMRTEVLMFILQVAHQDAKLDFVLDKTKKPIFTLKAV